MDNADKTHPLVKIFHHNQGLYFKYYEVFYLVFHVKLSKCHTPLWGFDVIKFADILGVPGDTSTKEFVTEKFCKRDDFAVRMIYALLEPPSIGAAE